MFRLTKRIVTATMVLAVMAPSAAYARFELNPPLAVPAASGQTVQNAALPSAGKASASSSQAFPWDDAGIGAAGALVLVGLGSGAMIARRRRTRHPLTS
jgi:hypothetical protein